MILMFGGGGFFEILFFLIIFAVILFLAYVTTRIVAKKSGIRAKSKYMEVVDRLDFGSDKQLFILRAGDEYFLLSKSSKNLDVLTKININEPDADIDPNQTGEKTDFKSMLEKHINFGIIKKDTKDSVFRKNIGKIKNMSESRIDPGDENAQNEGEGEDTNR